MYSDRCTFSTGGIAKRQTFDLFVDKSLQWIIYLHERGPSRAIMARGIQLQGPFCAITAISVPWLAVRWWTWVVLVVNTQAINHNMLITYFDSLPLLCLTILKKLSNTNTAYAVCKFIAFPRRLSFNFVSHTGVKLCLTTLCIAFTPKRGI